ncbi:MAG TPA: hypothetical protein VGK02_06665 [Candidatus Aquicultor sp.]|jgi:anaerobic magnesium-protoporphyrin IX monomethyl ester cyclase
MAREVLRDGVVGYVVRGEGEHSFPELLTCINAGDMPQKVHGISFVDASGAVASTPDRSLIEDLDMLPVAWDMIDWPLYYYRAKPDSRLAIVS